LVVSYGMIVELVDTVSSSTSAVGKNPKNNKGGDLLLWSEVVWNMLEYTCHLYIYYVFIDNVLKSCTLTVPLGLLGYYASGILKENAYTLHQRSNKESLRNL